MHFLFVHGTGGNPHEAFYPWLENELNELGFEVEIPAFPTPLRQNLKEWLKTAKPYEHLFDEQLVLVGRSVGGAFIPSWLEEVKPEKPVKASFLVAGFCSKLLLLEFEPLVSSFVEKKFDWPLIKKSCNRFFVYQSDNDPFVSIRHGEELAKNLGVKMRLFKHAAHFWGSDFPPILEKIMALDK